MIPEHLTTHEASKRLKTNGKNILRETAVRSPAAIFSEQFQNVLSFMLIAAAGLSFVLGDMLDGALILSIIILNALLGFFQEYRAERALSALKRMTTGAVKVYRDGGLTEIPSTDLVTDDVVSLEQGDKIPADATILEAHHFEVNEAALTGESLPVEKTLHSDKQIFMGTIAVNGRAVAKITKTGMGTRFGAIAEKLGTIKGEETPLEKKMAKLGARLGIMAAGAAGVVGLIGFLRQEPFLTAVLTAISLAVAAVPEGLPAVVTITLAVGTQRMARQRSILRRLAAIESLGNVTVIATDKTGTITQNDMRVTHIWYDNKAYHSLDGVSHKDDTLRELVRTGILCNTASISKTFRQGTPMVVGDKTEGSLLVFAHELRMDSDDIRLVNPTVEEFPFSSDLKTMTVISKTEAGDIAMVKGAPEAIISRSTSVLEKGKTKPLSKERRAAIEDAFRTFAAKGLRMIALAQRPLRWGKQSRTDVEKDLTFLGFVGIADPPRGEILHAIDMARKAGIRTMMITGDNELTATAIAEEVRLLEKGDQVLTGTQLNDLSDERVRQILPHLRIVARATPEQKYRIVTLLQQNGEIVAVTGDGVNDALALKQADIGVAMGISGTEVAKEAADMVITDDNYASLVAAIEEGRAIFDNIRATTKYLIGCNLGEIGAITGGVLFGLPYILSPLHILYVNLVTDGLPAIGLSLRPKQGDIMTRSPRKESAIFTRKDVIWSIEVGLLTAVATLGSFAIGFREGETLGRTLAFVAIILAQQYIFYDIAAGNHSIIRLSARRYPWLLLPVATIAIQALLLEIPLFARGFSLVPPPIEPLIASLLITTGILAVSEVRKWSAKHPFLSRFSHINL